MTDLPIWTPPDVGALLREYEAREPAQPRLELLDQYIETNNIQALRSLFDMLYRARNRAEHLSNTLITYIHAQSTRDPHVRDYFDKQLGDYNAETGRLRAGRIEAAKRITRSRDSTTSPKRSAPKRQRASAQAMDW